MEQKTYPKELNEIIGALRTDPNNLEKRLQYNYNRIHQDTIEFSIDFVDKWNAHYYKLESPMNESNEDYSVGLKNDGTVVAVGDNSDNQCNVSGWKNIVHVVAGTNWTIGLQADGKVLYTGYPRNVIECNDAISVAGSGNYGVFIRIDGSIQPVVLGTSLYKDLSKYNVFE